MSMACRGKVLWGMQMRLHLHLRAFPPLLGSGRLPVERRLLVLLQLRVPLLLRLRLCQVERRLHHRAV